MYPGVQKKPDGLPHYIAIREDLVMKIQEGVYIPGSRIPPEDELTKIYAVSRMTIRHAIDDLVNAGLLLRRQGVGTFVLSEQVRRNYNELTSFYEEMSEQGLKPTSKLLKIERRRSSSLLAQKLHISTGEEVYYLERLRKINGKPIAINNVYIPTAFFPFPTQQEAEGSLYHFYKTNGFEISYAKQLVQAKLASKEQALILQIPRASPVLYSDRVTYSYKNTPIERVEAFAIGDSYSIEMVLARRQP